VREPADNKKHSSDITGQTPVIHPSPGGSERKARPPLQNVNFFGAKT
jgi:hypothetical protein